jgi:hypothetical protein
MSITIGLLNVNDNHSFFSVREVSLPGHQIVVRGYGKAGSSSSYRGGQKHRYGPAGADLKAGGTAPAALRIKEGNALFADD